MFYQAVHVLGELPDTSSWLSIQILAASWQFIGENVQDYSYLMMLEVNIPTYAETVFQFPMQSPL